MAESSAVAREAYASRDTMKPTNEERDKNMLLANTITQGALLEVKCGLVSRRDVGEHPEFGAKHSDGTEDETERQNR
jgi:hypothetical protein